MKKDYNYFSSKVEAARRKELAGLAYHTRWSSNVLAFGIVERGEFFLSYRLRIEKEVLRAHVNALKIERDRYLENLKEAFIFLSRI